MMEIKLLIKVPDVWVWDIVKSGERKIKFMDCMPWGESGGRGLLRIDGTKKEVEEAIKKIEAHPDIEKVDASTMKEGGVILTVITRKCHACRALARSECFLLSSTSTEEGDLMWRVIAPNDEAITRLVNELEEKGTSIRFMSITPIDHKEVLTTRQLSIVKKAYSEGYYDIPKKTNIQKLAKKFKISPSTLAEILQRGERKVIGLFVKSLQ
jgi:predicted DNA binding protein